MSTYSKPQIRVYCVDDAALLADSSVEVTFRTEVAGSWKDTDEVEL